MRGEIEILLFLRSKTVLLTMEVSYLFLMEAGVFLLFLSTPKAEVAWCLFPKEYSCFFSSGKIRNVSFVVFLLPGYESGLR